MVTSHKPLAKTGYNITSLGLKQKSPTRVTSTIKVTKWVQTLKSHYYLVGNEKNTGLEIYRVIYLSERYAIMKR